ncbi:hypothetical protein BP6252_00195 [Coleophoma cylindrospora]|uniref:Tat pathway signal sequence n=1 Tax=Coleophoma cylindrospora TaxID=1849047 RepID=A0A3D8SPA9_9HELO|nr:hypothetical protein BP6252_00195 [Coleophoma cylindrospora]
MDFFAWPRKILFRSQEYFSLEKSDEESSQSESFLESQPKPAQPRNYVLLVSVIMNVCLVVVVSLFAIHNIPSFGENASSKDVIRMSSYSPLFGKVPISASLTAINGSFMDEGFPPDPFRALPSKFADDAWHATAEPTWITITDAEARSLGKNPADLVRAPEEWGHGSNKYIAMMDLNHQLHCVNQLRKAAFREEYPVAHGDRWDFQKEHWMHCVHILYQNVMCTGSTEIITYNWRETQRFPVPDFDTTKMCKNTRTLLDFQDREMVHDLNAKRDKMIRPTDAAIFPLPSHLKAFLDAHD